VLASSGLRVRVQWAKRARVERVWWRVGRLVIDRDYFQKGIDIGLERRIVGIVGSTDGGHRNGEGRAAMNRTGG